MFRRLFLLFVLTIIAFFAVPDRTQAQTPIVRAVLFYSPTCPHCHKVMTEDFPPLNEKYGAQLEILEINVSENRGADAYQLALTTFKIPQERMGVPALFVGGTHLVGSDEIPAWFPGIIEQGLQQGGIDWPSLPGLTPFIEAGNFYDSTQALTLGERFALDPVGNTVAVVVLMGLLATFFLAGYAYANRIKINPWPNWVLPTLVVMGLVIAGYLTFVEMTNAEAVCGPVGDCHTVQQSEYARLFGFLPVGLFGLIGYAGIGIAWIVKNKAVEKLAKKSALTVWWMALLGTLFSIYLTFLEPFVIGATCAWCLSSAVIMALLLWSSTPLALEALTRKRRTKTGRV